MEAKCPKCGGTKVVCATCGTEYDHDTANEWCMPCNIKNDPDNPGTLLCYDCDAVLVGDGVVDGKTNKKYPYKVSKT